MDSVFDGFVGWTFAIIQIAVAGYASGHAILYKRDVRSAIGWVGLIWLVPYVGALLYGLLGINRIRRRATALRSLRRPPPAAEAFDISASALVQRPLAGNDHLTSIATLLDRITPFPLTRGNRIQAFHTGRDAYDHMLAEIACATETIGLTTYIFDDDAAGRAFVDALAAAQARGVMVRVLVDGVGARYSGTPIRERLAEAGVTVAEFLPTVFPFHLAYANLRSHRKILVVDGKTGFTGGMNIRQAQREETNPATGIRDVHFRVDGPVVAHCAATFIDDWLFTTGELLDAATWIGTPRPLGKTVARGIAAGPDENLESIRWAILAALSQARERIRIVTPYFVPDHMLISSLVLASLRGVAVDIVVPEKNNLILVQWASQAKAALLLSRGCRLWRTPLPFDHSKLMTVDGVWSLMGSANWDQRSLRLNFEFNIECYDQDVAACIDDLIERKMSAANPWTLEQATGRSMMAKLRDGTVWLFSPYL